jgi:hypothetical protein
MNINFVPLEELAKGRAGITQHISVAAPAAALGGRHAEPEEALQALSPGKTDGAQAWWP